MSLSETIIVNRRHWAKILRSHKYKQTRRELRSPDGSLCCLGVAQMEFAPDAIETAVDLARCTPIVVRRLGLTEDDLDWYQEANDTSGWSFKDIATAIEAELP